jgi:uncharacterized protein (DUF2237 family)
MGFIRKHFWTALPLVGATVPLVGLILYANRVQTRTAEDLALADRCIVWSHESPDAQAADGTDLSTRCNLYFRARSNENAEEDTARWQRRAGSGPAVQASTDTHP